MIMMKDYKKYINNSLKEIQENIAKQVEVLQEKAQKSLRELQENTAKQVEVFKRKHKNALKNYRKTHTKR